MLIGVWCAHAVVLNGKIYIGGGDAGGSKNECIVMEYDPESGECSILPRCSGGFFAMAVVNNQILLAGGRGGSTDILTWDSRNHCWKPSHYPKMPSQRSSPAAVGYQQYLIVVCGDDQNIVEILDCSAHRWYRAQSVPLGGDFMTSAVVGDHVYISAYIWSDFESHVFSAHLPTLIWNAKSARRINTVPVWLELPTPPVEYPTLLAVNNQLLLAGGQGKRKELYKYDLLKKCWSECGQLPVHMCAPSCTVLPSGELFVFGGTVEGVGDYSKQVWRGELQ